MEFLAIADADRVQEYVFVPSELKMIRGASRLHVNLIETLGAGIRPPNRRISANGGVVLGAFATELEAAAFCRTAERKFADETASASVTTAYNAYPAGTFGKSRKRLLEQLEINKRSRASSAANCGNPLLVTCEKCGLREACTGGRDGEVLCKSCSIKRSESDRNVFAQPGSTPAESFEKIGEASSPENYLAIVYIDIDKLGRYLDDYMKSADASEEMCGKLSGCIDKAVRDSVMEAALPFAKSTLLTHEVLLMGGDDAVIALPASGAVSFLLRFEEEFVKPERWGGFKIPIFSAAMVMAHSHFPISEFLRIAKRMLRSAKEVQKENSVYFSVISGPGEDSELAGGGLARTAKPYPIRAFEHLANGIQELKQGKVPTSKIKALYGLAWETPLQGDLEYLYLLTRLSDEHRGILLKPELLGHQLWSTGSNGRFTRACDIVELWEFVHAE